MTRETLFMKAINEGLDQAMERDERVVLLGEMCIRDRQYPVYDLGFLLDDTS